LSKKCVPPYSLTRLYCAAVTTLERAMTSVRMGLEVTITVDMREIFLGLGVGVVGYRYSSNDR